MAQIFDAANRELTSTQPYVSPPSSIDKATLLPHGRVLITGETASARWTEIYSPASGAFTLSGITLTWADITTLLVNSKVLFLGGDDFGPVAELFDAADGKFTIIGSPATSHDCRDPCSPTEMC